MNPQFRNNQRFLKRIIYEAGNLSLQYRAKLSGLHIDRKSEKDLVTEADRAVERYIISQVRQTYPDHTILGEESGLHAGNDYVWVIDPIDGTTSFIHGHPSCCISIALQKNSQTLLAAVYAPVLAELYMAELHHGAALNGNPIHVSNCATLNDCLLNTGFACLRSDRQDNNLPALNKIAPLVRGIRMSGAAALDLSFVACGRSDGYWERNLNCYDIAAGMLLVSEAGGRVSDFSGENRKLPNEVFASNGRIHNPFLQMVSALETDMPA